ncbi:hypothetical protein ACJX0J_041114 [Zea mays]
MIFFGNNNTKTKSVKMFYVRTTYRSVALVDGRASEKKKRKGRLMAVRVAAPSILKLYDILQIVYMELPGSAHEEILCTRSRVHKKSLHNVFMMAWILNFHYKIYHVALPNKKRTNFALLHNHHDEVIVFRGYAVNPQYVKACDGQAHMGVLWHIDV